MATKDPVLVAVASAVAAYFSSKTKTRATGVALLLALALALGFTVTANVPTPVPTATTTSSPTPSQTPAAGFPTAATTGVPAGTVLSPYTGSCTIQTDNLVIDSKTVSCGQIRVFAKGVIIRNSLIQGSVYSESDQAQCAASAPSKVCSFTITDSTVDVGAQAGTGIGSTNFTALRVKVTGGNRSINCDLNCTVTDSYVSGQFTDPTGVYHESGIRMSQGLTLRHNTIECTPPSVAPDAGCSAAITGYGDFAIVQNNTIDGNLIGVTHDGFCMYGGSVPSKKFPNADHIVVTNNVFERNAGSGTCGSYGPVTNFDSAGAGNVWTNNTWTDGSAVAAAN